MLTRNIPDFGITKEEYDRWAAENDRALTDDGITRHLSIYGYVEGGLVAPKTSNPKDPVAQKLRGAGSGQR